MKPLPLFVFATHLISACTRMASTPAPTVLPLNFPVAAPALCQPADLLTSSNFTGTPDAIILGITLTNHTKNPCALANPAKVALTTTSGEAYDLLTETSPASQTPPAPANVMLAPDANIILTVVWRNSCQKEPADKLNVSISLSTGTTLDIPVTVSGISRCQAGSGKAAITVNPYSNPP